jgi:hypothetical protein
MATTNFHGKVVSSVAAVVKQGKEEDDGVAGSVQIETSEAVMRCHQLLAKQLGRQLCIHSWASGAAATVSGKQLGGARLQNRFSNIYKNTTEFKFQITFKFSIKVENM